MSSCLKPMSPTFVSNIINRMPVMYGMISNMNLFQFKGAYTETVAIDRTNYVSGIIPASPWCCDPKVTLGSPTREMFPITIPHTQLEDALWACDISGVRGQNLGFEVSLASVAEERAKVLARMKMAFDLTYEYRLLSALKGQVMDADGVNVLADLYQIFGTTQTTVEIPLNEAGTDVLGAFRNAMRVATRGAYSFVPQGWKIICGSTFFDKLVSHDSMKDLWKRCCDLQARTVGDMNSIAAPSFNFLPNITVQEYVGTLAYHPVTKEEIEYIGPDEAYMIPIVPRGVEMFELLCAPPKTLNFVNTRATQLIHVWERLICERSEEDAEGIKFLAESNYLPVVKHPNAVIKLAAGCGPAPIVCP